jgi:hypothetical protein
MNRPRSRACRSHTWEGGIDAIEAGGGRLATEYPDQRGGAELGRGCRLRLAQPARILVDEHQVEIARVGQLPAAEPPHPDDREGELGLHVLQGGGDQRLGQLTQSGSGLVHVSQVEYVPGRDPETLRPAEQP